MSPFREPPLVELGPLDVGLEAAARRAAAMLPRGGRILATPGSGALAGTRERLMGALGSAGLLLVGAAGVLGCATGFRPESIADLLVCMGAVVLGGLSLAAVFRALDRTQVAPARRGEHIGKKARAVLRRLVKLEVRLRAQPRGAPPSAVLPRPRALRRALADASDPEIATWIPADVRGRAELLLAREIAAARGTVPAPQRREVSALLAAAAGHLDDPTPAHADLEALGSAVQRKAW